MESCLDIGELSMANKSVEDIVANRAESSRSPLEYNMKKTLISLAVLWGAAALVAIWTPWRAEHLTQMGVVLVIACVMFGAFHLVAKAILRKRKPMSLLSSPAAMWSAKPLILFLVALLATTTWMIICAGLGCVVLTEGGYYLILLISGYVLSRWCSSSQYVPVLTGLLLLIVGTSWQTFQFLNNPSAQFRFGPEIVIFAASQVVGRLTMLPLDSVVLWGGWLIGEAIKGNSNKASEATSEPAPSADSSSPQGCVGQE
jgi:uncharacterized membrane protein